jgi:hypothetical protein
MNLLNYLLNNINLVPIIMYELCQQYKALLVYKPLYQYSARGIYGSYFFIIIVIYLFIYLLPNTSPNWSSPGIVCFHVPSIYTYTNIHGNLGYFMMNKELLILILVGL